jgi:hypothetical protein
MQAWLYQMRNTKDWRPEDYRLEVDEGIGISWPAGGIARRGLSDPAAGDMMVMFFAKSHNPSPGLYGWGTITGYSRELGQLEFQLMPPSDLLKYDPLWDNDIHQSLDRVRENGGRNTVWGLSGAEFAYFRQKIRQRAG